MKAIIVTGTPGTGKTTIAKQIAKEFSLEYVDVSKFIEKEGLKESYDSERKCMVVDTGKLSKVLIKLINKSEKKLVIDSHLSHYLPKKHVKLCVVTKCGLKELKKRLKKRGYDEKKLRENLDSEIFDICLVEAKEAGHEIFVFQTDEPANIKQIKKFI